MSDRRKYRAGDVVQHIESGEEWLLACDEWDGRVSACGWPESWNRVEEVALITPATDEARLERLREGAKGRCSRAAAARRALDAEKPRRTLADVVANPPEGWTTYQDSNWIYFNVHRYGACVLCLIVSRWEPAYVLEIRQRTHDRAMTAIAETQRAVADLLDVLAEVEP